MNWLLNVFCGDELIEADLRDNQTFTIGSAKSDSLFLGQYSLEPSHVSLTPLGTGIRLVSSASVSVNRESVTDRVLSAGDIVRVQKGVSLTVLEKRCDVNQAVSLTNRNEITIGRSSRMDISLPGSQVSSEHATLRRRGLTWEITDNKSRNGTFLDARRVSSADLRDNSILYIGGWKLLYIDDELRFLNTIGTPIISAQFAAAPAMPKASAEVLPLMLEKPQTPKAVRENPQPPKRVRENPQPKEEREIPQPPIAVNARVERDHKIDTDSPDVIEMKEHAEHCFGIGQYGEAERLWNKIVTENNPKDYEAWWGLVRVTIASKRDIPITKDYKAYAIACNYSPQGYAERYRAAIEDHNQKFNQKEEYGKKYILGKRLLIAGVIWYFVSGIIFLSLGYSNIPAMMLHITAYVMIIYGAISRSKNKKLFSKSEIQGQSWGLKSGLPSVHDSKNAPMSGGSEAGLVCPRCGKLYPLVQTLTEKKRMNPMTALLYIILLLLPVIGWIVLFISLVKRSKTVLVPYATCQGCGHSWRT